MRKKLIGLLMMVVFSVVVFGGDMNVNLKGQNDDTEWDLDLDSDNEGFVANGGPLLSVLFLDLKELNVKLKGAGFKEFEGQKAGDYNVMYNFGGGLIGGTFKNRFGGYGAGGTIMSTVGDKKAKLEVGYGGFIYEKGILMIDATKTNVSLGFLVGGGSATLTLVYDNIENEFGTVIGKANMNILTKEYLIFAPRLNIHQKIGSFIGLDLSAEYMMSLDLGESWMLDDEEVDGPLSNSQSPVIGARLSFGF